MTGLNFRVVEGSSTEDDEKIRGLIIDKLEAGELVVIKDIIRKVGETTPVKVKRILMDEIKKRGLNYEDYTLITSKTEDTGDNVSKNYYYDRRNKLFTVKKMINGKYQHFGYYKTEEEAKRVVEKLRKCNWDKSQLPAIKEKIRSCLI